MPKKTSKKTKDAVAGLFSGQAAKAGSKKKAKEHPEVELPKDLRTAADVMAAYRMIKDELKKKGELAEKRVKAHMTQWWCEQFALTGKRPSMAEVTGELASFQFIVSARLTITAEKQEALEMVGADLSDYIETSGLEIDMGAVQRLGYMDKLQQAISDMVGNNGDHLGQIFRPKVTAKEGILEALPGIAEEMEGDGSLAENIATLVDILKPVSSVKKPDLSGLKPEDAFKLVQEATLPKKD